MDRLLVAGRRVARSGRHGAEPAGLWLSAKPGKDADTAEHARGVQLFKALGAKQAGKIGRAVDHKTDGSKATLDETAARTWVRTVHAERIGIRREEKAEMLTTLPTLGDLTSIAGLDGAMRAVIDFLDNADVQVALSKYHIGAADAEAGKKLYDAWTTARVGAKAGKAGAGAAVTDTREARDASDAWLNKWWAIASVRLVRVPEILKALGVGTKKRATPAGAPVA